MTRRNVILSLILIVSAGLGWAGWYADARIDSYIHYSDNAELAYIDVAQVINACIADPSSAWQLPHCQRGVAAWGLYANDCRARHIQSLFFVEKHYACKWLEDHKNDVINVDPNQLRDRETQNALHELVRRHAWCQVQPLPCTESQTRKYPNWCLPEPDECAQAQLRSIDWLLERGADINQFEYETSTVLHNAVRVDDFLMVQELLERGANPEIAADAEGGITAIERARRRIERYFNGYPSEDARQVLELLESHRNSPD